MADIKNILFIQWQDPHTFALLLAAFVAFIFIFMVLIVWQSKKYIDKVKQEEADKLQLIKAHQQKIASATITSMEKERRRIAADLHDDLISLLRRTLLVNENIKVEKDIQHAINTARSISHDLMPPMLEQCPMKELINYLVDPLRGKYSIELVAHETTDERTEVKLHLFRILQELLSNIIKHAKADTINIHFSKTPQRLSLIVSDNGVGVQKNRGVGIGLRNIEMRCQIIKSKYTFEENIPQGTKFELLKTEHKQ